MAVLQFPQKEEPTQSGEAICFACRSEWVAVAPVGTVRLECPVCGTMKGFFKFECARKDSQHWYCLCGNALFYLTPEGIYCPNCGEWQAGF